MALSIVFFLVVSSGSIFGASVLKRKQEEVLPLSVLTIILIQYVFGLVGMLRFGAYFVFALAFALYIVSLISVVKSKSYHAFISRLLTPGFVVTVVLYLVINFANYGKLASSWDEFSHWADVVKAMVSIDDLATNATSMSAFPSYVPAMPLFQYNLQVLGQTLHSGFFFSEWHLYVGYQFATYGLLLYFLKDLEWGKPGKILAYSFMLVLLPSCFSDFYNTLYIDTFLGILGGFTFSYLLSMKYHDTIDSLGLYLSLACLVLTKDVGFFVAAFVLLLYLIKILHGYRVDLPFSRLVRFVIMAVTSVVLPKVLWSLNLKSHAVEVAFGNSINPGQMMNSLLYRDETDYRWVVARNFWNALRENRITLRGVDFGISYLHVIIALLAGILILISLNKKNDNTTIRSMQIGIPVFSLAYLFGMCAMYMFKFWEYEALRLASLSRYLGVLFLMLYVFLCFLTTQYKAAKNRGFYLLLLVSLVVFPALPATSRAFSFVSRQYVNNSALVRAPYAAVAKKSNEVVSDNNSKIYIVSQEDQGFDYWVLRYSLRPVGTNSGFTWSIGTPFYEGDVWTLSIDSEEWMNELVNEYEYVLLYKINDYFMDEFAVCFEHPEMIDEKTLFRVDRERRLLIDVRDSSKNE